MKSKKVLFSLCFAAMSTHGFAANGVEKMSSDNEETEKEMKAERRSILKTEKGGKGLTIGGYGEAVYSHNLSAIQPKTQASTKESRTDASTCHMWYFS